MTEPALSSRRVRSDIPFYTVMFAIAGMYVLLILAMLLADAWVMFVRDWDVAVRTLKSEELWYSFCLSLITCTVSALLSVIVAVPVGYLMSRFSFFGKNLVDTLFDIPIVLPPLVIGISLLILFNQTPIGAWIESMYGHMVSWLLSTPIGDLCEWLWEDVFRLRYRESAFASITFAIPAVIFGQFTVACAFSVRTMRVTFDQINPRAEQVALTLGCNQGQAFRIVAFPQAWRGLVAAFTLAWARSLGEFGPILVFAGAIRLKTEVLSTSVFLEFSHGNLSGAVAISLFMVFVAMIVLVLARVLGLGRAAL